MGIYCTTASDAGVTGYTPTGSDLTTMNFTDLLINNTDIVQTVTYQFTPKILGPNGTTAYCENGVDTTITIWINPQPKLVLPVQILCMTMEPAHFTINTEYNHRHMGI